MGKNNSKERGSIGLQFHEKVHHTNPNERHTASPKKALVLGVLGDFKYTSAAFAKQGEEKFINIDRYNFNDVMEAMAPGCSMEVANLINKNGNPFRLSLNFQEIKDFHPDNLVRNVPILNKLLQARNTSSDPERVQAILTELEVDISTEERVPDERPAPETETPAPPVIKPIESDAGPQGLLDDIIERSVVETKEKIGRQPSAVLDTFIRDMVGPAPDRGDRDARDRVRRKIDEILENQIRATLSHPAFKRLEATWLSLYQLVRETETGPDLKIKILDVSKIKLLEDLSSCDTIEESLLYRLIYEEELGISGGEPFGLLIGNYYFGPGSGDMVLLKYIAGIASLADAPFITAAAPSLLGLKDLQELLKFDSLIRLEEEAFSAWQAFQRSDLAHKAGICLPGILLRLPYGPDTNPIQAFEFQETAQDIKSTSYLWGNPAMVLARVVTKAFASDGWNMELNRYNTLGDLPAHVYEKGGEKYATPCAEVMLREKITGDLIKAGFIPFVAIKNTDSVKIPIFQSVAGTKLFGA